MADDTDDARKLNQRRPNPIAVDSTPKTKVSIGMSSSPSIARSGLNPLISRPLCPPTPSALSMTLLRSSSLSLSLSLPLPLSLLLPPSFSLPAGPGWARSGRERLGTIRERERLVSIREIERERQGGGGRGERERLGTIRDHPQLLLSWHWPMSIHQGPPGVDCLERLFCRPWDES
jgi:hypothetical protein